MYESIKFWDAATQSIAALCMIGIMFVFLLTIHYVVGIFDNYINPPLPIDPRLLRGVK
jgi:hypothetical protein